MIVLVGTYKFLFKNINSFDSIKYQ